MSGYFYYICNNCGERWSIQHGGTYIFDLFPKINYKSWTCSKCGTEVQQITEEEWLKPNKYRKK